MVRKYIYADESGDMTFTRGNGVSRYFVLTTIVLESHSVADSLTELRRDLAWQGIDTDGAFHAAEDKQIVRDAVFAVLQQGEFRIDATIMDKPKYNPRIRQDAVNFYRNTWYYHFRFLAPEVVFPNDELLVIAASIGVKKERAAFKAAIESVLLQVSPTNNFRCAMWLAASDTAIQIADYCSWAIWRKWERNDRRSYELVKNKIHSEFDLFRTSSRTYY